MDPNTPTRSTEVVHTTADEETKNLLEFYPPHPPRTSTPEYNATHVLLTHTLNMPCRDCGVRLTTISDPTMNPKGAKQLETHHWPLQREFADAIDPSKVQKEYPEVTDRDSLNKFIDSPKNMLVLCVLGDTKVLMANGTSKKIIDVRVGDSVIGHDMETHEVTATMSRDINENIYVIEGVAMTGNHPILTDNGFVEASLLKVGQIVYKVGMFSKYVFFLRSIQAKIANTVVASDSVNMMNSLYARQPATDTLLHHKTMLQNIAMFTTRLPYKKSDITLSGDSSTVSSHVTPRDTMKGLQTARVRTKLRFIGLNLKGLFTPPTHKFTRKNPLTLTKYSTTGTTTGSISTGHIANYRKFLTTAYAGLNNLLIRFTIKTGWIPINHIKVIPFIGKVYDIRVEYSSSFIANSMAVHNCDVDHRSPTSGIHHIGDALEAVKRFIIDGYILDDIAAKAQADLVVDEQLTASELPSEQI